MFTDVIMFKDNGKRGMQSILQLTFVFAVLTSIVLFFSYRHALDISHNVSVLPGRQTKSLRLEAGGWGERDAYKNLLDVYNDLNNFHLYFESLISQTRFNGQRQTIKDGYVKMSASVANLMDLSKSNRQYRLDNMTNFIRDRIERLQNPKNCSEARLAISTISNHPCGFGCTLHAVTNFLLRAFVANRTFVMQSKGWQYANEGWEYAFLPLGGCVFEGNISEIPLIANNNTGERMVRVRGMPDDWLQWSVPSELKSELTALHGAPFAWWLAQFTSYVFRMQPNFERELQKIAKSIGFSEDMLGIQVRWGDKTRIEASKHQVTEYMSFVEEYHKQLEMQGHSVEKRVYLATEDPSVWIAMWRNYPQYKFIGSGQINVEGKTKSRYNHQGLTGVVADIYFLSKCSYIVCTLSSSVCRTAYELMLTYRVDGVRRFQSLDALYKFRWVFDQPWVVIMDHEPASPEELELKTGDKILTSLDPHQPFNDGFLRGKNLRTEKEGKFPVFKAREELFAYNVSALQP